MADPIGSTPTNGAAKGEQIQKYLQQHPTATDDEVIAALAAQDIHVTHKLVQDQRRLLED